MLASQLEDFEPHEEKELKAVVLDEKENIPLLNKNEAD